jgi:vacuolar-type H+-ATPase subunit I/STV1
MSDKPDIDAIKARLAELRRADQEYVSVIANRPAMEPEYNYHLRVARREVEAHAPADIAALLAEVERLRAEKVQLLGAKNVTIQTPPILESEVVSALRGSVKEWQLEAERLRVQLNAESDVQYAQRQELDALRARLTLTPEKVEAAAKAEYEFDNPGGPEFKDCMFRCLYLDATRAALLAAGMEEKQ